MTNISTTLWAIGLLSFGCDGKEADSGGSHDHSEHDHGDTDLPEDFDPRTEHTANNGITVSYVTDPAPIPESMEFSATFTLKSWSPRSGPVNYYDVIVDLIVDPIVPDWNRYYHE